MLNSFYEIKNVKSRCSGKNIYKIIFLFLVSNVLILDTSYSQTAPAIEWQKSLGGTNGDGAQSVQQTMDGGYIVTGSSGSNDGDVTGNHGTADYWVVKLDSSGIIQWQKSLGGGVNDLPFDIRQTSDYGYIVAGFSESVNGDVTGNHGGRDYWIVKLDSTGLIQWQKSLGGTNNDQAYCVRQTADGGYIVAGLSSSNDGDVTGNHGLDDYWIVKLDNAGIIQWQKSLGGTSWEVAHSILQTPDGGYIVSGNSESNNGDVTGHHGSTSYDDYWVVKLNSSGNIQWQKSLGGTAFEYGFEIIEATGGGYIVSGSSFSTDGDVTGNHGSGDYWIVKIDSSGTIQWEKSYGGSMWDEAHSIKQTIDGGYVVAGYTFSNDSNVSGNHGTRDYWVVKLNGTGTIQWQKCFGGTNDEIAYSIQQTTDSGYILAGYSNSDNGDVTGHHGSSSQPDFWVVKLYPDTTTGIPNLQSSTFNFQFYPNPLTSQSTLTFSNPRNEKFIFTLYDITGRMCEISPLERGKGCVITTDNKIILQKGNKQAGVYLFNLTNQKTGERMNGKIIIAN